jgi:hypothetical protein
MGRFFLSPATSYAPEGTAENILCQEMVFIVRRRG